MFPQPNIAVANTPRSPNGFIDLIPPDYPGGLRGDGVAAKALEEIRLQLPKDDKTPLGSRRTAKGTTYFARAQWVVQRTRGVSRLEWEIVWVTGDMGQADLSLEEDLVVSLDVYLDRLSGLTSAESKQLDIASMTLLSGGAYADPELSQLVKKVQSLVKPLPSSLDEHQHDKKPTIKTRPTTPRQLNTFNKYRLGILLVFCLGFLGYFIYSPSTQKATDETSPFTAENKVPNAISVIRSDKDCMKLLKTTNLDLESQLKLMDKDILTKLVNEDKTAIISDSISIQHGPKPFSEKFWLKKRNLSEACQLRLDINKFIAQAELFISKLKNIESLEKERVCKIYTSFANTKEAPKNDCPSNVPEKQLLSEKHSHEIKEKFVEISTSEVNLVDSIVFSINHSMMGEVEHLEEKGIKNDLKSGKNHLEIYAKWCQPKIIFDEKDDLQPNDVFIKEFSNLRKKLLSTLWPGKSNICNN